MKKVSVVVATYNQEKFIGHTLESIVNQKTDFEYEVLVGEDCSTDNTAAVVKEYADRYPDIIIPYFRKKNLGMGGNMPELMTHIQGEYVAMIEGDDYWIDDHKLQKQVEFMDSHPEYVACFGKNIVVDENEVRHTEHEQYGNFKSGEGDYTIKEFEDYVLPGQTATSLYRASCFGVIHKKLQESNIDQSKFIDRSLVLCMFSVGKIYCFNDTFSAYRLMLDAKSGSWSSENDIYALKSLMNYLQGLKFMEDLARVLNLDLNFDNRRAYELRKLYSNRNTFTKEGFVQVKNEIRTGFNSRWQYFKTILGIMMKQEK